MPTPPLEAFKKAWDGYEDAYGSEDEETVSAREAYENCEINLGQRPFHLSISRTNSEV